MIIDNIGWNVEAVKTMTKKEFVNNPQHSDLYWRIPEDERKKALASTYDIITNYNPIVGSPQPTQIQENEISKEQE